MSNPTTEDAKLFLKIIDLMIKSKGFRDAFEWIFAELKEKTFEKFIEKYPIGSEGYENILTVGNFGEMIGLLVNRDLLNVDLAFDYMGDFLWDRVAPIVRGLRKKFGRPRFLENYELWVSKYPEWAEKNPPKLET